MRFISSILILSGVSIILSMHYVLRETQSKTADRVDYFHKPTKTLKKKTTFNHINGDRKLITAQVPPLVISVASEGVFREKSHQNTERLKRISTLSTSAIFFGYESVVLNMSGKFTFEEKPRIIHEYLKAHLQYRVIIVVDSYDLIFVNTLNESELDPRLVYVSAEDGGTLGVDITEFRKKSSKKYMTHGYAFVNSGFYMGYRDKIMESLQNMLTKPPPWLPGLDQGRLGEVMNDNPHSYELDVEGKFCVTAHTIRSGYLRFGVDKITYDSQFPIAIHCAAQNFKTYQIVSDWLDKRMALDL